MMKRPGSRELFGRAQVSALAANQRRVVVKGIRCRARSPFERAERRVTESDSRIVRSHMPPSRVQPRDSERPA